MSTSIRSLVWATDIDVLARDHTVHRHAGHWAIHSPGNPTFWWGNFLLFDDAPASGDGERWEQLFTAEFADRPEVTHRTFAWDRVDGAIGEAEQELQSRGYKLEMTSGLIVTPEQISPHARANGDADVVALDPNPGRDSELWEQVLAIQFAQAPPENSDDYHRNFLRRRQEGLRERFCAGDGAWYVARLEGAVAGSLGVVVTEGRARFQTVDTAAQYRRRGVATRLVYEAAQHTASRHPIHQFVMAADPDYHAISIYESLGFKRAESVCGALLPAPR
jgi:ribosomal protein S18 acetylase RimI-like enzyme